MNSVIWDKEKNEKLILERNISCSPPGEVSAFKLNLPILVSVD
jgi:hypothetical protein